MRGTHCIRLGRLADLPLGVIVTLGQQRDAAATYYLDPVSLVYGCSDVDHGFVALGFLTLEIGCAGEFEELVELGELLGAEAAPFW